MSQTAQTSLVPEKQTPNRKRGTDIAWGEVAIGDICHLVNGRALKPTEWTDTGLPIIRIQNLNNESKPFNYYNGTFDPKHEVNNGDVLISWSGTPGTSFGAFIWARGRAVLNQHIFRTELDESRVDKKFFVHGVNWRLEELIRRAHGGVGLRHITKSELEAVTLRLPYPDDPAHSLDIQHRIVARIEALLAEVKEARALAAAIRHDTAHVMEAALEEVFGRIREGFEVTDIPQSQIKPIEEVAQLERGKFTHRPRNDRRFFGGTIPWVQIQNVPRDHCKYITEHMDALNEDGLAISKLFPKGTLVVSIAATIGAVGILGFDACFPDSLVGITPDASQVEPGFLYWQLCYLRVHLDAVAPAAAQKNVNLQILGRINLWVPPIPEQKAIDAHLDAIQEEVGEMRRLQAQDAELLDQLEQSILERAFRGEL